METTIMGYIGNLGYRIWDIWGNSEADTCQAERYLYGRPISSWRFRRSGRVDPCAMRIHVELHNNHKKSNSHYNKNNSNKNDNNNNNNNRNNKKQQ